MIPIFDADEVNGTAQDVLQTLVDGDVTHDVALIALCKAIVMIATDEELDKACKMIDELSGRDDG